MKNESCVTSMLFCRKCKMLRWNVYETYGASKYKFLCKKCAEEEEIISTCKSCGREGVAKELNRHGGYCHNCEDNNIMECKLCGAEVYAQKIEDGICTKCATGKNKPCIKCGDYINAKKLSSDELCEKCSIKIHKHLRSSKINEVVECIECGREAYVNDLNKNSLCIYCQTEDLEVEIKKLKRKKSYNY